jgi:hypothetical protein
MSLHLHAVYQVPEATQRMARAAFPGGTVSMAVADRLGRLYYDPPFAAR